MSDGPLPNIFRFPDEDPADSDCKTVMGAPPLTVWSTDELLAWQPPADAVFVGESGRGYVCREELTTLIGPPGVGKSRLLLWMAVCHITGRAFAGLPTCNGPARWLLIGNENSRARLRHDLTRLLSALSPAEDALVRAHLFLHVMAEPRDCVLDLDDPIACAALGATLEKWKPDAVGLDPWANMIAGDENKNADVRDSVRLLFRLLRRNAPLAACILVHHARTGAATTGQAGNRYAGASLSRGGKALPAAARCEIAVWPGDAKDGSRLVLTCEKSNNAPHFAPRGLVLNTDSMTYEDDPAFDVDLWRDDVAGKRSLKAASVADVVDVVRECCRLAGETVKTGTVVELVNQRTGAGAKTVQRRLIEAASLGYLRDGGKRGSWKLGAKPLKSP